VFTSGGFSVWVFTGTIGPQLLGLGSAGVESTCEHWASNTGPSRPLCTAPHFFVVDLAGDWRGLQVLPPLSSLFFDFSSIFHISFGFRVLCFSWFVRLLSKLVRGSGLQGLSLPNFMVGSGGFLHSTVGLEVLFLGEEEGMRKEQGVDRVLIFCVIGRDSCAVGQGRGD